MTTSKLTLFINTDQSSNIISMISISGALALVKKTKIEEHLGTGLVSDRPTHTMQCSLYCKSISFAILAIDLISPD